MKIIDPIEIVDIDRKYPNQLGFKSVEYVFIPQMLPIAIRKSPAAQGSIFGNNKLPIAPR
jgi:hypothetical protein